MGKWVASVAVPIVGIVASWFVVQIVWFAFPDLPLFIGDYYFGGVAFALAMLVTLLAIGIWLHRITISKWQLFGALLTCVVYFGLWVLLLRDLEAKDGFLFAFGVVDVMLGLAPLLGLALGYICAARIATRGHLPTDDRAMT